MVTNDGKDGTVRVKKSFNVGWRTHCNDNTQYDPVANKCTRDCGVDSKCKLDQPNQAYPTKQQSLRSTESLQGWRDLKQIKDLKIQMNVQQHIQDNFIALEMVLEMRWKGPLDVEVVMM